VADAEKFCREATKNGILVTTGEIMKKSVVFRPSLLIEEDDVEAIITASKHSLDAV